MATNSHLTAFIIVSLLLVFFAAPTSAFGAGYVSPGSHLKSARFRHGDISLAIPLLATANRRIVKQIYFGNWLRDFSQLLDKGSMALVPGPVIRALIAVFAFLQFGYSTREFEVTEQRLGMYRPEEHVDNPCGIGGSSPPPGTSTETSKPAARHDKLENTNGLRGAVHPSELAIDPNTGMKNYIANGLEVGAINPTSAHYVEQQLISAIACGRQGDEEAYVHLGAALHALEDFTAHSNYIELAMQMIGSEVHDEADSNVYPALKDVFAFVGGAAKVETARGSAAPLVTGTFGALDLLQTLLGEIDDKLNAVSLPSLQIRTPSSEAKGPLQTVAQNLISLLGGLTPRFEAEILKVLKSVSEGSENPAIQRNELGEAPDKLWESLEPVLKLRDDIVKWLYDHLAVRAVQDALAAISKAIDKLIFLVIGIVLKPVLPDLSRLLKDQEQRLLREDQAARVASGEQSIFDTASTATDPTHSQLAKDHYDHPLNEPAGRVAVRISSYAVSEIVQLWQPGNTADPQPSIHRILEAFHHPFNYSRSSRVQILMLDEVRQFITDSSRMDREAFLETVKSLSLTSMASRMDSHGGGHTHVDPTPSETSPAAKWTYLDNPLMVKLGDNIESQVRQGSVKNVSIADLPMIKEILVASPSADSPNPLDTGLAMLPGINFLDSFREIGIRDIAAADGLGETLKDAIILMILLDEERAFTEEELAAISGSENINDPRHHETKGQLKQLRPLLSFNDDPQLAHGKREVDDSKTATVSAKLNAGIEKLKLKANKSS